MQFWSEIIFVISAQIAWREIQLPLLIIHLQEVQHAHWLRTPHLIPNSAESWNRVQKVEIELIDR